MILVADSGSTKTEWVLLADDHPIVFQTKGLNPLFYDSVEAVLEILTEGFSLAINEYTSTISKVYFYGAGCVSDEKNALISNALKTILHSTVEVSINSDLLAAARALLHNNEGIACILGTGANSCLYDGVQITYNISALGYILGDEGSGANIGKRLVGDIFKEVAPKHIREAFEQDTYLSVDKVITAVYKNPFPNRFLAQLTHFVYKNLEDSYIVDLVTDCFDQFCQRNICQYNNYQNYPTSFTGSVAYYFQDILKEVTKKHHIIIHHIIQKPIDGLIQFHNNQ